jgi:ADP-ribose pyrophosphatase
MQDNARTKSGEIIGKGNWLELVRDGTWEYVRRNRGTAIVVIIALTDAHEIVLVEQPRAAMASATPGGMCIELPAGIVGDEAAFSDEGKIDAARRELEEETGFQADTWVFLHDGAASPGLTTEIVSVYRATGLTRVSPGGGVDGENITVHVVPLSGVHTWLAAQQQRGCVVDIKVWGAITGV